MLFPVLAGMVIVLEGFVSAVLVIVGMPLAMHLAVIGAFAAFAVINAYVAMRLTDWFAEKVGKRR